MKYHEIAGRIHGRGDASAIFLEFSKVSNYSPESIRKAFYRLKKKQNDLVKNDGRNHGNEILTSKHKALIIGYLLMRSNLGIAAQIEEVCSFSRHLLGFEVSSSTAFRFLNRRQDLLRITREKGMDKNRICDESIRDIEIFIENYKEILEKFPVNLDHLINADETLLRGAKDSCTIRRIEAQLKSGGSIPVDTKSIGSLTPFVSASGIVWLVVICLKLPKSSESRDELNVWIPSEQYQKRSDNSPLATLLLGSSSGLLNSYLWDIAVKRLIEVVRNCSITPSKEIILLTDNLGIHRQPSSICDALCHDLYQIYFPPNCSHFIQPLDNILFAGLKRKMYKISASILSQSMLWEGEAPNLQKLVLTSVAESFPSIFSIRNIKKAWVNVGVHPFNPELMRHHAELNVGKVRKETSVKEKKDLADEAQKVFESLHQEYQASSNSRKRKTCRVTISGNWAESGSTGIKILESVEKKRRLDEENEKRKRQEKEERERAKQERQEQKERKKEKRKKEKEAKVIHLEKEKKRRKKEREKREREKKKEKEKKEKMKKRKHKEEELKRKLAKNHQCKVDSCHRKWSSEKGNSELWVWCDTCDEYGICFFHARDVDAILLLQNHEESCQKE